MGGAFVVLYLGLGLGPGRAATAGEGIIVTTVCTHIGGFIIAHTGFLELQCFIFMKTGAKGETNRLSIEPRLSDLSLIGTNHFLE